MTEYTTTLVPRSFVFPSFDFVLFLPMSVATHKTELVVPKIHTMKGAPSTHRNNPSTQHKTHHNDRQPKNTHTNTHTNTHVLNSFSPSTNGTTLFLSHSLVCVIVQSMRSSFSLLRFLLIWSFVGLWGSVVRASNTTLSTTKSKDGVLVSGHIVSCGG